MFLGTARVTVYTNNVHLPDSHTAVGEGKTKQTQEECVHTRVYVCVRHTPSMADMEREQSLICNH